MVLQNKKFSCVLFIVVLVNIMSFKGPFRLKSQHFPYSVSGKVRATACPLKSHAPQTTQIVVGF